MNELTQAFILGNQATLTNVCMLPLYPDLIAFLAGDASNVRSCKATTGWLGLPVLLGILTIVALTGLILTIVDVSFRAVFTLLLPIIYGAVIVLGLGILAGWNRFTKLSLTPALMLRNPYLTAYFYGMFFGPMTLPCTGPIILSAFAIEAAQLADSLIFFLVFEVRFGWPLVILPSLSLPFQHQLVHSLTANHLVMIRASSTLLIAIGIVGVLTELVPQSLPDFSMDGFVQVLYWLIASVISFFVGWITYRTIQQDKIRESISA